jgi:hypothetical protein
MWGIITYYLKSWITLTTPYGDVDHLENHGSDVQAGVHRASKHDVVIVSWIKYKIDC